MKLKNILSILFLVFILFAAISIVSAEDVSDNGTVLDSSDDLKVLPTDASLEDVTLQKKNTKIIAKNSSFIPNSGKYFTTTLKDSDGKNLVNKTLKISLNGKTYTRNTNSKGQVSLKITLKTIKTYKTNIKFLGDSKYNRTSISVNITVKKFKTKIIANTTYFIPKSGKYYKITLKDQYNNPLSGYLKITLNKKTYYKKTNSTGQISIKIGLSTQKKYLIKIKFAGTKKYYKSSTSTYIIKKEATKIVANNFTCKAKTKASYKVTLKNKNNIIIKNKKISLTTNGKTYTKTTNSKGEAIFTLNMPSTFQVKKIYDAEIQFKGDYGYIKSSKNISITVISKENMFINASNKTLTNNESYYKFRVYGNGNYSKKKKNLFK